MDSDTAASFLHWEGPFKLPTEVRVAGCFTAIIDALGRCERAKLGHNGHPAFVKDSRVPVDVTGSPTEDDVKRKEPGRNLCSPVEEEPLTDKAAR